MEPEPAARQAPPCDMDVGPTGTRRRTVAWSWPDPLEHAPARVPVGPRSSLEGRRPGRFGRVAAANAAVLGAACVITALAFRDHASDVALRELAIFAVGLALMLGL